MPDPSLSGIDRVRVAIAELNLAAEIVHPGVPMPTVLLAAGAIGCRPEQIIKTVIFLDRDRRTVVGIANGTARIDRKLLASAVLSTKVSLADPATVLDRTGFPAGGVSPIGIRDDRAIVVVDAAVLSETHVYGGAGTEDDLLLLSVFELLHVTSAIVATIVNSPVGTGVADN
jgi:prolyl-tRNA editing enzyme YbaK/EbsC (Cys-tRNA(Pro) deacylase)